MAGKDGFMKIEFLLLVFVLMAFYAPAFNSTST